MTQTYISLLFDKIHDRLDEIRTLLALAEKNQLNTTVYSSLCRSAHVLLVSHFEGMYKDVCKSVIADINANTNFREVRKDIFFTYCNHFIFKDEDTKSTYEIKLRLREVLDASPTRLKVEPFLFVDNKNPAPAIIETILNKFGVKNFFWSIDGSDLDLVFANQRSDTKRLRRRIWSYTKRSVSNYPYTSSIQFYNPIHKSSPKIKKTLWEAFLDEFLKARHDIIHGDIMDNPSSHEEIDEAINKIEILMMAFIINICSTSTPVRYLLERNY